jgi:hypothetical protein
LQVVARYYGTNHQTLVDQRRMNNARPADRTWINLPSMAQQLFTPGSPAESGAQCLLSGLGAMNSSVAIELPGSPGMKNGGWGHPLPTLGAGFAVPHAPLIAITSPLRAAQVWSTYSGAYLPPWTVQPWELPTVMGTERAARDLPVGPRIRLSRTISGLSGSVIAPRWSSNGICDPNVARWDWAGMAHSPSTAPFVDVALLRSPPPLLAITHR